MSALGLKIYFGDASDLIKKEYVNSIEQLTAVSKKLGLKSLYGARQVHGIASGSIDQQKEVVAVFDQEVDALLTDQKGVGVGVFTADCLPVLLYDPEHKVVAAVHAGWKGAVAGILQKTIKRLTEKYQTNPADLYIYFGPSIKICCYQVGQEVVDAVEKTSFARLSLYEREEQYFFDLLEFAKQVLLKQGCRFSRMDQKNSLCTRCIKTYHSYRRDGDKAGRQISIIAYE
jgi:YfiH family protein